MTFTNKALLYVPRLRGFSRQFLLIWLGNCLSDIFCARRPYSKACWADIGLQTFLTTSTFVKIKGFFVKKSIWKAWQSINLFHGGSFECLLPYGGLHPFAGDNPLANIPWTKLWNFPEKQSRPSMSFLPSYSGLDTQGRAWKKISVEKFRPLCLNGNPKQYALYSFAKSFISATSTLLKDLKGEFWCPIFEMQSWGSAYAWISRRSPLQDKLNNGWLVNFYLTTW